MAIAFQLVVFAAITISFILVVGIPIVLASIYGWSNNKKFIFSSASSWIKLVF